MFLGRFQVKKVEETYTRKPLQRELEAFETLGSAVHWSARSSDSCPLDYFIWRKLKSLVLGMKY